MSILPILEFMKVIIQFGLAFTLFTRWFKARVHFFTDIPFIFGVTMFSIASGELLDALMDYGILNKTLSLYQIRILVLFVGAIFLVYLICLIWLRDNVLQQGVLVGSYATVFIAIVFISSSIEKLLFYVSVLLAFVMIPGIITFFMIWRLKRIPELNSGLIFIGGVIILIGQFAEYILLESGLLWVCEFVDLIGWIFMLLALFIKPSYALMSRMNKSNGSTSSM
ncbi:MAG: hypothetical protein ACP6IU_05995 [Candidatus Asgardarchaeia archaeon]